MLKPFCLRSERKASAFLFSYSSVLTIKDLKDVEKIPKRIQQIDKLSGNISDLEAQLADLNQEIEALRSQLPPGTVVETDD